jgi:hypothetical protein
LKNKQIYLQSRRTGPAKEPQKADLKNLFTKGVRYLEKIIG